MHMKHCKSFCLLRQRQTKMRGRCGAMQTVLLRMQDGP